MRPRHVLAIAWRIKAASTKALIIPCIACLGVFLILWSYVLDPLIYAEFYYFPEGDGPISAPTLLGRLLISLRYAIEFGLQAVAVGAVIQMLLRGQDSLAWLPSRSALRFGAALTLLAVVVAFMQELALTELQQILLELRLDVAMPGDGLRVTLLQVGFVSIMLLMWPVIGVAAVPLALRILRDAKTGIRHRIGLARYLGLFAVLFVAELGSFAVIWLATQAIWLDFTLSFWAGLAAEPEVSRWLGLPVGLLSWFAQWVGLPFDFLPGFARHFFFIPVAAAAIGICAHLATRAPVFATRGEA